MARLAGDRSLWAFFLGMVMIVVQCAPSLALAAEEEGGNQYPKLPFSSDFGGAFQLTDHNGRKISDRDFLGNYVILYFGYTRCADTCPTALHAIGQALVKLGEDASQVTPVFVNLDPERDSLSQMRQYVHFFHPSFVGLTGTEEAIGRAAGAYGIRYRYAKNEDGSTRMIHSGKIFLLSPTGQVADYFPHEASVDWLVAGIARNLSQATANSL
jgi:cytochrome oxidase Cu insertion factor (SCO1/SenC/PrrC family)